MYCLFYALKYLPTIDALVLTYTRALFIPLVIWIWFQKKLTGRTWWGLAIGFAGILFILKPEKALFDLASIVGLMSGLFGALAFTTVRKLTKTEPLTRIIFYYLAFSVPISFFPAWGGLSRLTPYFWVLILIIGILAAMYQLFLTLGYKYAKTSKVTALLYTSVIFAALLDWWVFGLIPDLVTFVGISAVCVGSVIVVRDRKKVP